MRVRNGRQCIRTNDGYVMPLDIVSGLPYTKMQANTKEFEDPPHVILASGDKWDPKVLDKTITKKPDWYNDLKHIADGLIQTPFEEYGNFRHRRVPEQFDGLNTVEE